MQGLKIRQNRTEVLRRLCRTRCLNTDQSAAFSYSHVGKDGIRRLPNLTVLASNAFNRCPYSQSTSQAAATGQKGWRKLVQSHSHYFHLMAMKNFCPTKTPSIVMRIGTDAPIIGGQISQHRWAPSKVTWIAVQDATQVFQHNEKVFL